MNYRIFVVEDHPVMREVYENLLEAEPDLELCEMADSAEQFFERLPDTDCDVVVTDLLLPGADGFALVERLQAEHPALPVIVISAHEEPAYLERSREAGACAYLSKRDLARDLAPTVTRVMRAASAGEAVTPSRAGAARQGRGWPS